MDTRASPEGPGEKERPRWIDAPTAASNQPEAQPQMAHLHNNGDVPSGRNRLRMPNRTTFSATPVGERPHHPWNVPRRSQGSSTKTAVGPRELSLRGKGLLSWVESTTTDS